MVNANKVPSLQDMDVSSFTRNTPSIRASLWEYYREYHLLLDCPSVILVVYEDLCRNTQTNIRRIANFMNILPEKEDLIERVTHLSTKEYIKII